MKSCQKLFTREIWKDLKLIGQGWKELAWIHTANISKVIKYKIVIVIAKVIL